MKSLLFALISVIIIFKVSAQLPTTDPVAMETIIADNRQTFARHCGNNPTSTEVFTMESRFQTELARIPQTLKRGTPVYMSFSITIPVYVHVIVTEELVASAYPGYPPVPTGLVTLDQIHRQIQVLNGAFKPFGISFVLHSVETTANTEWFEQLHEDEVNSGFSEFKSVLKKGGKNELDLYLNNGGGDGILGYATFPDQQALKPVLDGVVIRYDTLPGGTRVPFNQGDTAVHEVGHWLGLYHTFQGGCNATGGDLVDDTPAEESSASGCPFGRDTCPTLPGLDPICNYMDYTDDACLTHFTPGQGIRMRQQWELYRRI